ncbi:DsbA family protein [Paraburkholderia fungorum]|uniref:DsbA family protein n=1 Tax=Paraburkholderia fungorum TaxID=134537 RepID=UPI00160A0AEE|nr:DsbA family protein [Paraburkholderia fungorum]MBB5547773.1 thiol:disulfide interchange protein DsbA [Paraburkholderia fungorum]
MSQWTKGWKAPVISATVGALIAAGVSAWIHPHDDYKRTDVGYELAQTPSILPDAAAAERDVVTDYFYYGCPHCRAFEPMLEAWARQHGPSVTLKRVPVTGDRAELTREADLFYALDSIGAIPRLQEAAFQIVARNADFPASDHDLAEWATEEGIEPQRLVEAYHAPDMQARIDAGDKAFRAKDLAAVPAIAVHGRWIVTAATAGSIENMPGAMTGALSAAQRPGP